MPVSILPKWFRNLDTVVKLGLGVFVGSFVLIWGGMFLTRPDRTIPPYSIGSQEGTAVAVHVPSWTSDTGIETLIHRFQKVAREGREFGLMKPTAYFVNCGRARTVDQDALVRALREHRIAGAGLDVFPIEPLPRSSALR